MKVPVSVVKGGRYRATKEAIELLQKQIKPKLIKVRKVIIKPNFISWTEDGLPITRIDTVKAVVTAFKEFGIDKFAVCESSPKRYGTETNKFFAECGYFEWAQREGVDLVDLNTTNSKQVFKPQNSHLASPIKMYTRILNGEFVVSLAKLKTHDSLIATLGLKNAIMGSVDWKDKPRMHGFKKSGFDGWSNKRKRRAELKKTLPQMHYNMHVAAHAVYPNLVLIDGVMGMEGNGPVHGDAVMTNVTIASTDAVCADEVAAQTMGVKFEEIVWEQLLKEKLNVEPVIKGEKVENVKKKFIMHDDYDVMSAVSRVAVEKLIKENPVKLKVKSKI